MKANLMVLAALCKWVYHGGSETDLPHDSELLVDHPRYAILKSGTSLDTFTNGHVCVVVHRGTASADDMIHDIESQIGDECTPEGWIKPFRESLLEFRDQHEKDLAELKQNGDCEKYILTGHSLGGATAAVYGANHDIIMRVTFGEPKSCCGPAKHHSSFEYSNHIRVINGNITKVANDPVPSWPRHDHYHHCSPRIVELEHHKVTKLVTRDVDTPQHGHIANIGHHKIDSYLHSLQRTLI